MKAVEHYREAERLLDRAHELQAEHGPGDDSVLELMGEARVRATLALAGATAMASYVTVDAAELGEWEAAAGGEGG